MKLVIAYVKPFRARAVLTALEDLGLDRVSVREVMGYNRQKERLHRYLGSEYNASFLPKVEISLTVPEAEVQAVVRSIVSQARTGRMGDGKILVLPCLDAHVVW